MATTDQRRFPSGINSLPVLLVAILLLFSLTACSRLLNGSQEQDTMYFAPSFYNNQIIALRFTWGPEIDPGSGRYPYRYLVSLNESSTEETVLCELAFSEVIQLETSNTLTYIGLLEQNRGTLETEYLVEIFTQESYVNLDGAPYSTFNLTGTATPSSIKFSPDESKLALSFGNNKFIITDLQGNIQKESAVGGNFIWKNNDEGFCYLAAVSRLALFNLNNDTVSSYEADIVPMTYNSAEATIYSLSGNTLEAYVLGGAEVRKVSLTFDSDKYVHPKITIDGQKILLTATPYNPPCGSEYLWGGVYLLDVAADTLTELKYYSNEHIIPAP